MCTHVTHSLVFKYFRGVLEEFYNHWLMNPTLYITWHGAWPVGTAIGLGTPQQLQERYLLISAESTTSFIVGAFLIRVKGRILCPEPLARSLESTENGLEHT